MSIALSKNNSGFTPIQATGGTINDVKINNIEYRVHTFTSSGDFVVSNTGTNGKIEYLVVAGGGSGSSTTGGTNRSSGGGGAGGVVIGNTSVSTNTYSITIGAGGAGSNTTGNNGQNSTAFGVIAIGGGGGGNGGFLSTPESNGLNGGSGGAAGQGGEPGLGLQPTSASGGLGSDSLGYNGGGAGGAGAVSSLNVSLPLYSDFNGQLLEYAAGGGGGQGASPGGGTVGGDGTTGSTAPGNGVSGTGSGGGASSRIGGVATTSGAGGSGIVIVRYPLVDISSISNIYYGKEVDQYGLDFNGSNDEYVELENTISLNTFTISIDFEARNFVSSWVIPIGSRDTSNYLGIRSTDIYRIRIGGLSYDFTASLDLNKKTNMTFTHDGSVVTAYLDGDFIGSLNTEGGNFSFKHIGSSYDTTTSFYSDLIVYDLQIWNKALTQQELENNIGKLFTGEEPGLIAYFPFIDENGTGTTLINRAFSNNGTIVGADWQFLETKVRSALVPRIFKGTDLVFGKLPFVETIATGGNIETYEENGVFYKSHTFLSSGDFQIIGAPQNATFDYLVIAGGGGGGAPGSNRGGGGGGAGGYRTTLGTSGGNTTAEAKLSLGVGTYSIIVGAGGASQSQGNDSVLSTITSIGGGAGNSDAGGSGGGAYGSTGALYNGGIGTAGQGFNGGSSFQSSPLTTRRNAGGGGGAGGAGQSRSNSTSGGGNGGVGLGNTLRIGSEERRGGGGGGGTYNRPGGIGVDGGATAPSAAGAQNGNPGAPNTGGGGSGAKRQEANRLGGAGGSGIVIIRYEVGEL